MLLLALKVVELYTGLIAGKLKTCLCIYFVVRTAVLFLNFGFCMRKVDADV